MGKVFGSGAVALVPLRVLRYLVHLYFPPRDGLNRVCVENHSASVYSAVLVLESYPASLHFTLHLVTWETARVGKAESKTVQVLPPLPKRRTKCLQSTGTRDQTQTNLFRSTLASPKEAGPGPPRRLGLLAPGEREEGIFM